MLDLGESILTVCILRAITVCFGQDCSLRTLKVGNLKLLDPTGGPMIIRDGVATPSSIAAIAAMMEILFQMSVRCPTLTEIEMLQYRDIVERHNNPARGMILRLIGIFRFRDASERDRNLASVTLHRVDTVLRFNREGRSEIVAANAAARKSAAITVLADFNGDLDCLYEAVKLAPILFRK